MRKQWRCPHCEGIWIKFLEKRTVGVWRVKCLCVLCDCIFWQTKKYSVIINPCKTTVKKEYKHV